MPHAPVLSNPGIQEMPGCGKQVGSLPANPGMPARSCLIWAFKQCHMHLCSVIRAFKKCQDVVNKSAPSLLLQACQLAPA
ncbi:hypothetical protein M514_23912 [Trichuris suis]|uniref:Uncharacterized protein n=1 Tax=Trichuris suis TaxID=68888 RepID=A0A085N375_9BILA|nr:hypothetical protein M514_23912 [Trichuris suis]